MASERQVAANRKNAGRSTGPKEGAARSRLNATKHGLAGASPAVEARLSPDFDRRRAEWAAEHQPVGPDAGWALDRAVAASFQIERCERALADHTADVQLRGELAWDQDRAVEAATTLARLAKDPVLASRQLQTTLAGVVLLIEAWFVLIPTLEKGDDWSEAECSKALDLLGVPLDGRSGRTRIDRLDGSTSIAFRLELAAEELARLEELRDEAMVPLDELERAHAMAGDVALLSKEARLLLRYEREAWKRYREAMKEVRDSRPAPSPAVEAPPKRPAVAKRPVDAPSPSFEEERRALQAAAAPLRRQATEPFVAMGFGDEDAWLDEMERRIGGLETLPGLFVPIAAGSPRPVVTDRTRFGGLSAGPDRG